MSSGDRGARHEPAQQPRRWPPRTPRSARAPRAAGARCSSWSRATCTPTKIMTAQGVRERDRGGRWRSAARPTRCCTCSRSPTPWPGAARARRLRDDPREGAGALPTSSRSGSYVATDLHKRRRHPAGHEDAARARGCSTATVSPSPGKTVAENLRDVPDEPPAGQDVMRPWNSPVYAEGHLAILRGNLAPEGAVAKISGIKLHAITGPARVFESEEQCMAAILADRDPARRRARDPLRGAEGRTRHARDAVADLGAHRQGARRLGRPASPTAASRAAPTAWSSATSRPEAFVGGPIALVREGDSITIDAKQRLLQLERRRAPELEAPPARLEAARAALHARRAGEVREARVERVARRGHGPRVLSWIAVAAVLGTLSVVAGAFGAHGLRDSVTPERLSSWQTGAHYALVHSAALLALAPLRPGDRAARSPLPASLFTAGVVLFSGSIFGLVLWELRALGPGHPARRAVSDRRLGLAPLAGARPPRAPRERPARPHAVCAAREHAHRAADPRSGRERRVARPALRRPADRPDRDGACSAPSPRAISRTSR